MSSAFRLTTIDAVLPRFRFFPLDPCATRLYGDGFNAGKLFGNSKYRVSSRRGDNNERGCLMNRTLCATGLACLVTTLIVAPTAVAAPPTEYGVYELHLQPAFDFQDSQQTTMTPLRAGLGYYLTPYAQVGGYMSLTKKKNGSFWGKSDVWGLGVFGEAAMNWDYPVLPYLGLSLGFLDGDGDNSTAFVATLSPGVKGFLMETLALSLQLDWNFSNEPIYDFDRDYAFPDTIEGSGKKSSLAVSLALRILFY